MPSLTPSFTVNSTAITAGQTVQFTDTTTGGEPSLSYQWNFGNGTANSTIQAPAHRTPPLELNGGLHSHGFRWGREHDHNDRGSPGYTDYSGRPEWVQFDMGMGCCDHCCRGSYRGRCGCFPQEETPYNVQACH